MIEVKGKHNTAKVFTDNVEDAALNQIQELCDQTFVEKSIIRIMPDTHAGAGCTIGTTMTIKDKIVPNLVGVDIGCGMYVNILGKINIDFAKLDKVIRNYVPSGFDIRDRAHDYCKYVELNKLKCINHISESRAILSIGTLGGGNHFIEINKDNDENIYLVIHSGSRYLGKQIADYYQNRAVKECKKHDNSEIIRDLKAKGKEKDIQKKLKEKQIEFIKKTLSYVKGDTFLEYINDMGIAQSYAEYNRKAIADVILKEMGLKAKDSFTTIHNYIDIDDMILRKGAISAKNGEVVIIPINMKDGSIIATGKGNIDWNQSAPHGAGRIMSRKKARENLSLEEFKKEMDRIYTTSVSIDTLDEAPAAYKPMDEIIKNVQDTVEINKIVKPLYNFKASEV